LALAQAPLSTDDATAQTAVVPPATLTGSAILLVEDDPVNRLVAQEMLLYLGCSVDMAQDGHEALACLAARLYQAVLMDCQMPTMDGYTATQQWRQEEASRQQPRVPIIALTANAIAGDRERCLAAGMDDHLGKPFVLADLQALLQRWVTPLK
jgi:CheY-like chemotaxis protein